MAKKESLYNQEFVSSEFVEKYVTKNKKPAVIIPLGSLELHEYLPMGIDTILAKKFTEAIAKKFNMLSAPVLPIGHSPEHVGIGVVWFRSETYIKILRDIIDSYIESGFKKLIFLNCHAGNQGLLRSVILSVKRYLREYEISDIEVWDYLGNCFNAKSFEDFCIVENSLGLYFGLVDKDKLLEQHKERENKKRDISSVSPWLTSELDKVLLRTLPFSSKEIGEKLFNCALDAIVSDLRKWMK